VEEALKMERERERERVGFWRREKVSERGRYLGLGLRKKRGPRV